MRLSWRKRLLTLQIKHFAIILANKIQTLNVLFFIICYLFWSSDLEKGNEIRESELDSELWSKLRLESAKIWAAARELWEDKILFANIASRGGPEQMAECFLRVFVWTFPPEFILRAKKQSNWQQFRHFTKFEVRPSIKINCKNG